MGFIINGIIKSVIDIVTRVFDIFFSATLGILGVNLNVFEKVFPLVKSLNVGIITIALGIAFYIFIYQIWKNLSPTTVNDAESPLSLLASFSTTIIVIIIYRPLLNILLSFTTGSLTILQSSKLTKILEKGLATTMYDTFLDSLTTKVYFSTKSKFFIIKKLAEVGNKAGNAASDVFDAATAKDMPQRIAAIILVAYIYSKLYKIMKIIIRTYVGVGILTYLAPLPLATRASKTTKGYATNFIQIYIEHLVSILLNCWFLRIVFDGFGAIDFSNLKKMSYSMSGITSALRNWTYATYFDKTYELFATVFIWVLMIGAFIDYAVNLNVYIERISGIGGLSMVPNSSHPSNPMKESPISRVVTGAMGTAAGLAIGVPLQAMKSMAGKKVGEKLEKDFEERSGIFSKVPKNEESSDSDTSSSSERSGAATGKKSKNDTAMGGNNGSKPNGKNKKNPMEPFSPAADNSKQAGMYSLLHKPLSGKDAKKQMAAAMKGKDGFMDPYGDGKEYLDKLKNGKSKEDQKKLDNSLVFDAGKDGMQIMSDIESDGKGKITATMNGEDIELFNEDAQASATGNLDASVDIGGQTMSYDSSKCPTFHKMMGGITFDESDIVSSGSSSGTSTGTVGNSSSSGMNTSSETVFRGESENDVLGNESMGASGNGSNHTPSSKSSVDDINSRIYNPGSSQTYDDFTVGNDTDSSSGGPLESSKSGPKASVDKDVNTDQNDIEF